MNPQDVTMHEFLTELQRRWVDPPLLIKDGTIVRNALMPKLGAMALRKVHGACIFEYCGADISAAARTVYFFYFGKRVSA